MFMEKRKLKKFLEDYYSTITDTPISYKEKIDDDIIDDVVEEEEEDCYVLRQLYELIKKNKLSTI